MPTTLPPSQCTFDNSSVTILGNSTQNPTRVLPNSLEFADPVGFRGARPRQDFKVIVLDETENPIAFMTVADITAAEAHEKPAIFEYVDFKRLCEAMLEQAPEYQGRTDLVFRGEQVMAIRNDTRLRYVLKEAYYAEQKALRLFLIDKHGGIDAGWLGAGCKGYTG